MRAEGRRGRTGRAVPAALALLLPVLAACGGGSPARPSAEVAAPDAPAASPAATGSGPADGATGTPARTVTAVTTPADGATVGIGMPVSLRFGRAVADRAAVERAVTVTADPPVPVVGHWFGDQRLDLRPQHYWAPGTRVTVRLAFPGQAGGRPRTLAFRIGRAQLDTADLDAHTLTVRQGATVLRTLPISAGNPEHPTYTGLLVVSEKDPVTRMNSATVGMGDEYDIKDVPHAMRLTASGTFVHGNYWSPRGVFGTANTSHGCIGLADEKGGSADSPAGWFFDHTLVGDVIEVVSQLKGGQVPPQNGLNGWNLTWDQWVAGSALSVR
ncbi:L,D-transpeptidase [Kitasatospora viridis]|uniref:Lipoprotein-anchoring transpeptidase ErfK/SrfK n=1 Tax=Kitasatospora viridis TaxID=281105 RepID=A0A561UEQ7_9ACTN|nr:L,D-transpeptidase [Kitasatospora viridis]TWF97843.1 lipoprotein-anchoring transpeptidase ErfK/SrfK [Kitasatospora viridis]